MLSTNIGLDISLLAELSGTGRSAPLRRCCVESLGTLLDGARRNLSIIGRRPEIKGRSLERALAAEPTTPSGPGGGKPYIVRGDMATA
jgi:hypothetical protein